MKSIIGLLSVALLSTAVFSTAARSNIADPNWRPTPVSGLLLAPSAESAPPAESMEGNISPASRREIEEIQAALGRHGFTITVDGVWGPNTEKALHEFEKEHGLLQSNLIDYETARQLNLITLN